MTLGEETCFPADRLGRRRMISGHHDDAHARGQAASDGGVHSRPEWIANAKEPQRREPLRIFGGNVARSFRHKKNAQTPFSKFGGSSHQGVPGFIVKEMVAVGKSQPGTTRNDALGCPFQIEASLDPRGAKRSGGIKRNLRVTRRLDLLAQSGLKSAAHDRGIGRVGKGVRRFGMRACQSRGQQDPQQLVGDVAGQRLLPIQVRDHPQSQAALGQRAGLVRTGDAHPTQRFHGGDAPYLCVMAGKPPRDTGLPDARQERQALGNGRNSRCDAERKLRGETAAVGQAGQHRHRTSDSRDRQRQMQDLPQAPPMGLSSTRSTFRATAVAPSACAGRRRRRQLVRTRRQCRSLPEQCRRHRCFPAAPWRLAAIRR